MQSKRANENSVTAQSPQHLQCESVTPYSCQNKCNWSHSGQNGPTSPQKKRKGRNRNVLAWEWHHGEGDASGKCHQWHVQSASPLQWRRRRRRVSSHFSSSPNWGQSTVDLQTLQPACTYICQHWPAWIVGWLKNSQGWSEFPSWGY